MKTIARILLLFICSNSIYAQEVLKLEDCLQIAYENNLSIDQFNANIEKAQANLSQSKYEYLPGVYSGYSHKFTNSKGYNATSNKWGSTNGEVGEMYVSAELYLFKGLSTMYNHKIAQTNAITSKIAKERQKLAISLEITQVYYTIQLLNTSILIIDETLQKTKDEISKLNDQIKSGTLPKSRIYDLLAQESKEIVRKNELYTEVNKQYFALSQLMNYSKDYSVSEENFLNSNFYQKQLIDSIAESVLINSVLIAEKNSEIKASEHYIDINKASLYPTIKTNAYLSSGYLNNTINPSTANSDYPYNVQLANNRQEQLSLTITYPLFERKSRATQIKLARVRLDQSIIDRENTQLQLKNSLSNIKEDLHSLESRIITTNQMVEHYSSSYNVAQDKFRAGLLNSFDLNLVKNNYTGAQLELNKLYTEYFLNIELLKLYEQFNYSI